MAKETKGIEEPIVEENTEATAPQETAAQGEAPQEPKPKRVKIFVPRAASNREDPNLFVGINGVNYLIPKGKTSEVPDFVAEEIRRADAAATYQDDQRNIMIDAGAKV